MEGHPPGNVGSSGGTIQMSEMISEKSAAELKASHPVPRTPLPPGQHWYFFNFASVQAALNYLKCDPGAVRR
jgi:hypothetical protein